MRYIDLRSDTVTHPTREMREAMYKAEVGDDVWGDDPTVKELEALAAELLGKEAALFVTSGTQGNIASVMAHTRRGEAVIMGRKCHVYEHEAGAYAALAGVSAILAEDDDAVLRPESVASRIRGDDDPHIAKTGLVCIENALANGNVAPVENLADIYAIAHEKGIPVHLDGARIYNAAAHLGVDVKDITANCDSVMCCLSKGLCAPAGSILAGNRAFIAGAKRIRKILGGGMRQTGILAAAGILALTEMTKRVSEDHENAKYLAGKLKGLPGVRLNEGLVKINMLFFTTAWSKPLMDSFPDEMLKRGIKVLPGDEQRFVTNNGVSREDCDAVVAAIEDILAIYGK